MGLCPSSPAAAEGEEEARPTRELKPWQDPAKVNLAEKYLEHQASLRTRERQRQLLNQRLEADSAALSTASRSRRGRSSTVRSMAGRSDCDDATRSQHEAMVTYARNSSLSRVSTASLATASHPAAPRLTAEAAAARDAKLRERLRKEEEELAVAMAVSKSEAEAAEAVLAEPISMEDAEAIATAQADLNRRKSFAEAGAAAAARPSITIDTRQEWASGADGHSPSGGAAPSGTPGHTPGSSDLGSAQGGSAQFDSFLGSPLTSAELPAAGGSGEMQHANSGSFGGGFGSFGGFGGVGDDSSDAGHSMAGDSTSSYGTCHVAESAPGYSPRNASWPGQGTSPRDGYSRRQPAQWTLPPTVEEEAYRRASLASSSGRRRSGSSFGTAPPDESRAPGRVNPLAAADGLSRRSGSYATAAVAPQPGFGPSLSQTPAAAAAAAISATLDPARQGQLPVTTEIQPAPLHQLSAPLQRLSVPPPVIEEPAVEDVRRASFVTAVTERPSAARRRQRAESQGAGLPEAAEAAEAAPQQPQQQHRHLSLERPPRAATSGALRSSSARSTRGGGGGGKQGLEQGLEQGSWAQERRQSLQQERRASLEAHRQQLLQRRSGGVGDVAGDASGVALTPEGLALLPPLQRSSSSDRELV